MTFPDLRSWESYERYLQQLTSHLRAEPPPNYMRPTLPQILKADRQVFLYLIRVGVDLKRQPDNTLLLDSMMLTALQSYEVGFHLLPLPQLGSKSGGPTAPSQGSTHDSKGKGGSWGDRPSPYKGKGGGSSTNGKNKGGKAVLPKFLLGRDNTNMNMHGRRPCFNFQVGKCSEAPDGGECPRGWHLCCRRSCYAPHPERDHGAKKK